ncbi:hypothetical protein [Spiroplasma platyhelix]|uniref:Lipoprotein n=1 Tax=Spiroplasma platyhelix PALS-1 TaxID=1276218 RepID=A0A846U101_9MOLU|nr:hypothetical protein [Spiroplasma platyhelix]MBE4704126.1 hypothetical protein [Spiroplasma platyhelix PALS-1]NKE38496.1 hypothetical protein [Spiroplasma platyhelix PALS-1]UJB29384.1 hypothetical protein SPLAT_v1c06200 [Spiroplasma platyhelix PALS-1]
MNKNKILKITLLSSAILACISIPIILYFTIGQKDTSTTTKINLQEQNVTSLADVQHAISITEQEANTIKSDIQSKISTKMTSLGLEAETDYTVSNIDTIKSGVNLTNVSVNVNSVSSSTKVIGSLIVTLNIRENMSDRSISTINVPTDESENLGAMTADNIQRNIIVGVDDALNEGQTNRLNIDYEIVNLSLIVSGAKFSDYSTQISVRPITSSKHLTGTFSINFQLQ